MIWGQTSLYSHSFNHMAGSRDLFGLLSRFCSASPPRLLRHQVNARWTTQPLCTCQSRWISSSWLLASTFTAFSSEEQTVLIVVLRRVFIKLRGDRTVTGVLHVRIFPRHSRAQSKTDRSTGVRRTHESGTLPSRRVDTYCRRNG